MGMEDIQRFRRNRLVAAAEKAGGKAALGRLLGYEDGSFVGQMIRGKTVSEETVLKLESQPGFQGWFQSAPEQAPMRGGLVPGGSTARLQVVRLLSYLSDEEREAAMAELKERVARALGHTELERRESATAGTNVLESTLRPPQQQEKRGPDGERRAAKSTRRPGHQGRRTTDRRQG